MEEVCLPRILRFFPRRTIRSLIEVLTKVQLAIKRIIERLGKVSLTPGNFRLVCNSQGNIFETSWEHLLFACKTTPRDETVDDEA